MRFLVVDDEPECARVLVRALEHLGHEARCVHDADEALAALAAGGIEVLLSDLAMPGTDGLRLAELVHARWPSLPVVFATGNPPDDPRFAAAARRGPVLAKPWKLDALEHVIAWVAEGRDCD